MKQIDNGTLMDLQNQQDRLNKQGLKDMLTKTIAQATGKTHLEIRSLVDQEKQASVIGQIQAGLEVIEQMNKDMKEVKQRLADMLLEEQKKNEVRKQQMASSVSLHLGDVPKYELGHGEAVLVQHMMGGKGMGKSRSSVISSLKRPEEDVTEHAKEREAQQFSMATPRPSDDAGGKIRGGNAGFVRKALMEREEDAKEAVSASSGAVRFVGGIVRSMFAPPRKLSPATCWLQEDEDKKQYEAQLRRQQKEAKEQKEREEQREREREWQEWYANQPPSSRAGRGGDL